MGRPVARPQPVSWSHEPTRVMLPEACRTEVRLISRSSGSAPTQTEPAAQIVFRFSGRLRVTSAGSCPASLSSLVPVLWPSVSCSCLYLSCRLCLPLHDPFFLSDSSIKFDLLAVAVQARLASPSSPLFLTVAYLLIHSGGGSISAAGACPASLRPLPAKRLTARTVMS